MTNETWNILKPDHYREKDKAKGSSWYLKLKSIFHVSFLFKKGFSSEILTASVIVDYAKIKFVVVVLFWLNSSLQQL